MSTTKHSPEVEASLRAYGRERDGLRLAHLDSDGFVGETHPLTREERETHLHEGLAAGATKSIGAGNRATAEEPDEHRLCFEVDADRIRYSTSFRRLAGKCQVFVAPQNDHLRNRLTHALETAQVGVAISRIVGLNTPLVEAIALGHDCGHGPTGHASEEALTPYLEGGYDHAPYGADVTLAGLNLCVETLDGIRNHSWKRPAPGTPEGELVSVCDRIAYVCHDWQDALVAGVVSPRELPELVRKYAGETQGAQLGYFIGQMVNSITSHGRVGLNDEAASVLDAFRASNFERIYLREASQEQAKRSIHLLRGLCEHFIDMPGQIPDVASGEVEHPGAGTPEAAALAVHYLSGMTDRYALALGVEILGLERSQLPRGV